jgi:hypothetical protein
VLLLIRTPLVPHAQLYLGLTVLLRADGPSVAWVVLTVRPLRCLGRPYGPLWSFSSSGGSQLTEYLSFGHSYAVWLR